MENKISPPKYILKVYENTGLAAALKRLSRLSVVWTAVVFGLCFLGLLLKSTMHGCTFLILSGVPFLTVTLVRRLVDVPRPYDVYEMPKGFCTCGKKAGRSFPSRHVFSAFVIGTLALAISLPLGIITLALGCALAFCRVLLGIHFVRDVVYGALIGVFSGVLGIIIVNYCL